MKLTCLLLLSAVLLVQSATPSTKKNLRIVKPCEETPSWSLVGLNFPKDVSNSELKLVAFLKASCSFCRNQSVILGQLRDELASANYTKISYLIVNSFEASSNNKLDVFRNITTIDVYQDNPKAKVWDLYKVDTDDMVIFDKCNRVIFHLTWPDSIISTGKVKEALIKAYNQSQCSKPCDRIVKQCEVTPSWSVNGLDFPKDVSNSTVKLVAFLKASCSFCRNQSVILGELRDELAKQRMPNISYLIVNSFEASSNNKLDVFRNITTIDVYQDNPKAKVWDLYNANTDDMVIFDNCNRVVAHLTMPYSIITNGKVKEALIKAYSQRVCIKPCENGQHANKPDKLKKEKRITTTKMSNIKS